MLSHGPTCLPHHFIYGFKLLIKRKRDNSAFETLCRLGLSENFSKEGSDQEQIFIVIEAKVLATTPHHPPSLKPYAHTYVY